MYWLHNLFVKLPNTMYEYKLEICIIVVGILLTYCIGHILYILCEGKKDNRKVILIEQGKIIERQTSKKKLNIEV